MNEILHEKATIHNEFIDFIGIDSYSKGILAIRKEVLGHLNEKSYELVLLNLTHNNKTIERIKPGVIEGQNPEDEIMSFVGTFIPVKIIEKETFKSN